MLEEWKPIVGYPGYEISSLGRIWSYKRKRLLPPKTRPNSYLSFVILCHECKSKRCSVSNLVGKAFLSGWKEGMYICHKDETLPPDKIHGVDNLWVGTPKQNTQDSVKKRRHKNSKWCYIIEGVRYETSKEAAEAMGCHRNCVVKRSSNLRFPNWRREVA